MPTANDLYLGIEIGGTKLQLAVGTTTGTLVQLVRYTVNPQAGAAGIQQQLEEGIRQLLPHHPVKAAGVGFGGPVNREEGTVSVSHQIEGWKNFPLRNWLQQQTGVPVVLENDANTAALAEAVHGAAKRYKIVFYCTIGSGIGGGLVVDKTIYHGHNPGEAEVGHLRVDKSGKTLESLCSGWAVNNRVRTHINAQPKSLLAQLAKNNNQPEAALLAAALQQGDEAALALIADVADDLAFAFSHVVHLFHPEILVIGGGLSQLQHYLLEPLENALPQYVMKAFLPPPPVRLAALGEQVVPIGAWELAKTAIQSNMQNDCY